MRWWRRRRWREMRKTEELIAFYLQNYRRPDAYRDMADALEGFPRAGDPRPRCGTGCRESTTPAKMQQRHSRPWRMSTSCFKAYVACDFCGINSTPAVLDEVGIRLVSSPTGCNVWLTLFLPQGSGSSQKVVWNSTRFERRADCGESGSRLSGRRRPTRRDDLATPGAAATSGPLARCR